MTAETTKTHTPQLVIPDEMLDAVANRFKLLSEPMRLRILRILSEEDHTVQDIVRKINASQANISKHLTLMHDNGMVSRRKVGLKCYYSLADESIIHACNLTSHSIVSSLHDQLHWLQKVVPKSEE